MSDDLLPLRDAAALVGLSRQRLDQAVRSGDLAAERVAVPLQPRPVLYVRRADLEAWAATRRPAGYPLGRPRRP